MTEADYFRARAERHRRMAERAANPASKKIHEQLATAYESKAAGG